MLRAVPAAAAEDGRPQLYVVPEPREPLERPGEPGETVLWVNPTPPGPAGPGLAPPPVAAPYSQPLEPPRLFPGWCYGWTMEQAAPLVMLAGPVLAMIVFGVTMLWREGMEWFTGMAGLDRAGWVLGIAAAVFFARAAVRPIVVLVPLGLVAWLFSPEAAVVVVVVGVIAATWATTRGDGHAKVTRRRTVLGNTIVTRRFAPSDDKRHGEKCSDLVAVHEGGHAAELVAAGGKLKEARAYSDGSGYTKGSLPCRPSQFEEVVDDVAFSVGGEVATGTTRGCSADHAMRDDALSRLPANQQSMARTAGYANARSAQRTHAHIARRVANALRKRGRYG